MLFERNSRTARLICSPLPSVRILLRLLSHSNNTRIYGISIGVVPKLICWQSKRGRCLIPADGFYEWKRTGKSKQPFCFEVNDGALFAFAGLWDRWKDLRGTWLTTCSILTTTTQRGDLSRPRPHASDLPSRRIRLLVRSSDEERGCCPRTPEALNARQMRSCPVSTRINHAPNDDEECSCPMEIAEEQRRPFADSGTSWPYPRRAERMLSGKGYPPLFLWVVWDSRGITN
jgi:hypothetical protein